MEFHSQSEYFKVVVAVFGIVFIASKSGLYEFMTLKVCKSNQGVLPGVNNISITYPAQNIATLQPCTNVTL